MKPGIWMALIAAGLAGCVDRVVPTERGIGFDDYGAFELERARREAALAGPRGAFVPPPPPAFVQTQPQRQIPPQAIPSSALAQAGIGQATNTSSSADPSRTGGLDASPSNPAPALAGLSDEQSFDAVAGRETIESDAQRRAAQAAAREQITPTAVPERPSNTGPNIVQYALNAPNAKGQEWYSRSVLSSQGRFQRNCAEYATPDDAQRDFLAQGGPDRDRRGIDPDGDGFACGWDPAPFIQAVRN